MLCSCLLYSMMCLSNSFLVVWAQRLLTQSWRFETSQGSWLGSCKARFAGKILRMWTMSVARAFCWFANFSVSQWWRRQRRMARLLRRMCMQRFHHFSTTLTIRTTPSSSSRICWCSRCVILALVISIIRSNSFSTPSVRKSSHLWAIQGQQPQA